MNKFTAFLIPLALICISANAQQVRNPELEKHIKECPAWTGLNTCPYDFVYKELKESKAPKGYKPFYISHYGRHGTRSDWNQDAFSKMIFMLGKAKAQGILSASGDSLRNEVSLILEATNGMNGRLTPRGFREHRDIAERMYKRYSKVFKSGNEKVRVLSSEVPRCIMSMSAFTGKLEELQPSLQFDADCGPVLQKVVSNDQSETVRNEVRAIRTSLYKSYAPDYSSMMSRIFTDPEAGKLIIQDTERFAHWIFAAGKISNSFDFDFNTLRFLPFDAIYKETERNNIYMYLGHCNSLQFGDSRMARTQPLVWDVVNKADDAIENGSVCADLRFGHDYPLLALSSYFGLEGVGERYTVEEARLKFDAGNQSPFAGNLQLIFYKASGKPVLVKFLLNESERKIVGLESENGPYYKWEDVKMYLQNKNAGRFIAPLAGRGFDSKKERTQSYQGMDIWNAYIFSLQNAGAAAIYKIEGNSMKKLSDFEIGSANELNHCNVASFLPEFYKPSDPFPLVCISRCNKTDFEGMKDQAYIERIAPDMQSSEVIATINYEDINKDFGYALQWVIDRDEKMLYGYGNTIENKDPENKRRIIKFRLPEIKGKEGSIITLRPEDALENYLIEETEHDPFRPVGQGAFIQDGKMYLPTGFDSAKNPSLLYIWDLRKRSMEIKDLSTCSFSEMEDCSIYNGKLWIQTQEGIFRIDKLD